MAEHPLACGEWLEDLAGWLTAQLSPEREARLGDHLETCATCRDEADSLLAVAAVSLATDPDATVGDAEEPSADLGERIVATISSERRSRRLLLAGLVALAGAAAAVVAMVTLQTDAGSVALQGEQVAFTVVPRGATVDAVIAEEERGSIVQLEASGLEPGVTYALWLSPPDGTWDERVAAGTFRPDEHGTVDVRLSCALPADAYGRVWATTPDGEVALDTE